MKSAVANGESGKKHATYRLSAGCLEILNRRAIDKGLTRTAIIEMAVRDFDKAMDRMAGPRKRSAKK
jgi:hypothetical protein